MTPQPKRRWTDFRIDGDPALIAPACRTLLVIVNAWQDTDGESTWHEIHIEIHPVLAIESRRVETYHANGDVQCPTTTDPAGIARAGFRLEGATTERRILFAPTGDWTFGITDLEGYMEFYGVDAHAIVAAPWTARQDRKQLAPTISRLIVRAVQNAKRELSEGIRTAPRPAIDAPATAVA